jgi:hypothetical protein
MTASNQRAVLRDLRRTRKQRRLGDTEWFDVAYRVYLFALGGLIAVVLASDAIGGVIGDDVTSDDLLSRGPSVAGLLLVVALGLGLRSGADGGPVSIEVADVSHLLLAPIRRRDVLLRPVVQRIRSAMFSVAVPAGVLGQFIAREVEGSRAAWAAAGAAFGALTGATFVASAVLSHALRAPRWLATMIGALLVGWQTLAAWATWPDAPDLPDAVRAGPADLAGSIALWGIRQRGIDLVAVAVVGVAVVSAMAVAGRLRVEPLVRRGRLVSQLRFAATVQDLRTVVLLRRQLRAESLRSQPWFSGVFSSSTTPVRQRPSTARPVSLNKMVWRRGLRSLRRLPASRLARIAALALTAGVCASLAASASLLFLVGLLGALFLLGMESIEPLSQEIDRPDITDSLPIDRGQLFALHLFAPAALLAIAGAVGATAAAAIRPEHAAAAFAIALPTVWAGALGPVIGAVRDAPSPIAVADTTLLGAPRDVEVSFVPPEFAGFSNAFATFMPVVISAIGLLPLVAMRADPGAETAVRCAVGLVLVVGAAILWIRRRDVWGVKIRAFFEAGREQKAAAT